MSELRTGVLASIALVLAGCGGGGGDDPPPNVSPVSNAGADQAVDEQSAVTLSGSGQDSDGTVAAYLWSQVSGTSVGLTGADTAVATFDAPSLSVSETLVFELRVTDDDGAESADTVSIRINPVSGLNTPPVANAGPDQTVAQSSSVMLDGAASSDPDGAVQSFDWQQTSGPGVTLDDSSLDSPSFTAPAVGAPTGLVFELTVADNENATDTDTVTITVVPSLSVTISGTVTFDYVPVATVPSTRLDYSNTEARPARAVAVQLLDTGNSIVDATTTDVNGGYSLTAPSNLDVFLRVRAEMLQSSPAWDVRVADNTQGGALYVMDGAQFNTGNTDSSRDLHAASGWNGVEYADSRAAAPFAILDLVYDAMQLILATDPAVDFPALVMYWSPNNVTQTGSSGPDPATGEIGGSFFRTGPDGGIYLLGEEDDDTEEYDRHVIAHEWGHYFEYHFSRSDSIGGPHTLDDRLDMRVAFGEGFGNAVSGMITGDPIYADTGGTSQSFGFSFDLEGTSFSNPGWYNEFSIQEILYDIFDPADDDPSAIGFGPIYDVLVGPQADTTALTSIFSFIDALKDADPGLGAELDTLAAAQSITAVADEYGSTETNDAGSADVLPVYETLTVNGAAVNVCSTDEFTSGGSGAVNKLGSRRYIRFNAAQDANYTVTATTTSSEASAGEQPDPDMWLHRGAFLFPSEGPPSQNCDDANLGNCVESFSGGLNAGDYVLEVYEWSNTNAHDDPDNPPIGRTCFDVEVTSP